MKGFHSLKKIINTRSIESNLFNNIQQNDKIQKLIDIEVKIDKTLGDLPYEIDHIIYKEE
jgi:hypothetical protein